MTDPIAAMQPGAPAVWDDVPDNIGFLWKRGERGEPTQALRDAAHVTRLQFTVSRVTANIDGAAWRLGRGRSGRPDRGACLHQSPFNCAMAWPAQFQHRTD